MKRYIASFLLSVIALPVYAIEMPQGSKFDNRIQWVNYNAGDVVVVRTVTGIGSRIVFAPDETILDVASGFTQGWEFSERRNILYIKAISIPGENDQPSMPPVAGRWDTNLMVTTNRRLYDLDLHLLPGANSGRMPTNQPISYRVEFRYPDEDDARKRSADDKYATRIALNEKPKPKNWNYSMQVGDSAEMIAPTMAYDDGRFTYLKFPNNRDFPSAFLVAPDKTESLVNSHIDPEFPEILVLHRVSRETVLRLGTAVVGIYNDSFDADGIPTFDGTTVPGVKRVVKEESP